MTTCRRCQVAVSQVCSSTALQQLLLLLALVKDWALQYLPPDHELSDSRTSDRSTAAGYQLQGGMAQGREAVMSDSLGQMLHGPHAESFLCSTGIWMQEV
jgi:hypothetical protein